LKENKSAMIKRFERNKRAMIKRYEKYNLRKITQVSEKKKYKAT
jgi:hypothetical protein